jgi:hypothetical protein
MKFSTAVVNEIQIKINRNSLKVVFGDGSYDYHNKPSLDSFPACHSQTM